MTPAVAVLAWALSLGRTHARSDDPAEGATPADQTSRVAGSSATPGMLRRIGGDFRRFASRPTLVTLAVGGAASLGVSAWDRPITDSFRVSRRLDAFFRFGDTAGGARVQIGFALAAYSAGRVLHDPKATDLGRDLIRVQVLNGVVTQALKWSVRRERPNGSSRLSFPSGHTSASFATATVLARRFGWRVGVPAYALAAYVAGSRIQDHKHFPSDVAFGSALGIAAGRSVTAGGRSRSVSVGPGWFPQGPGLAISVRVGGL